MRYLAIAIAGLVVAGALASSLTGNDARTTPGTSAALAPTNASVPAIAIGDPRRLPGLEPGVAHGVLYLGTRGCALRRIDLATLAERVLPIGVAGCRFEVSPNGRYVASIAGADARPALHDLVRGSTVEVDFAVGPSGTGPISVADDGTIAGCTIDGAWFQRPGKAGVLRPGRCANVIADGRVLLLDPRRSTLVDAESGAPTVRLDHPIRGELPVLQPTANGRGIAAATWNPASARLDVRIFDLAGALVRSAPAVALGIRTRDLHVAGDATLIVVQTESGWAIIRTMDGRSITRIGSARIVDATVSPDGRWGLVTTRVAAVLVDGATLAPRFSIPGEATGVAWIESAP